MKFYYLLPNIKMSYIVFKMCIIMKKSLKGHILLHSTPFQLHAKKRECGTCSFHIQKLFTKIAKGSSAQKYVVMIMINFLIPSDFSH